MPYSLAETTARIASARGWRKLFTPEELVQGWNQFVEQCECGYPMSIYEYENDASVRQMIENVLVSEDLAADEAVLAFTRRVAEIDARFRGILQPGVEINEPDAPWWMGGAPRYAGAELAGDFRDTYGVVVEVREPQ